MTNEHEQELERILALWTHVQGVGREDERTALHEKLHELIGEIEGKAYDRGIDKVHEGWTGL